MSAAKVDGSEVYANTCSCQLAVQMADRRPCLQIAAGLQDALSLRPGHGMVVSRPGSAATALYDPAKVESSAVLACQRWPVTCDRVPGSFMFVSTACLSATAWSHCCCLSEGMLWRPLRPGVRLGCLLRQQDSSPAEPKRSAALLRVAATPGMRIIPMYPAC